MHFICKYMHIIHLYILLSTPLPKKFLFFIIGVPCLITAAARGQRKETAFNGLF